MIAGSMEVTYRNVPASWVQLKICFFLEQQQKPKWHSDDVYIKNIETSVMMWPSLLAFQILEIQIKKRCWKTKWTVRQPWLKVYQSCCWDKRSSRSPVWSYPCARSSQPARQLRSCMSRPPTCTSPSSLRLRLNSCPFLRRSRRHPHVHSPLGIWQFDAQISLRDLGAVALCRSPGPTRPEAWAVDRGKRWRWTAGRPFLDALQEGRVRSMPRFVH